MKSIKSLLKSIALYVVGPFITLARPDHRTKGELIVASLGAAARVVFGLSLVVAVPALAVTLAKVWLVTGLAARAITVIAAMIMTIVGMCAFLGAFADARKEEVIVVAVAEPVPA